MQEERVKVLEDQVRFLRNWIYNTAYPLAPMSAKSELEGFDAIKETHRRKIMKEAFKKKRDER